MKKLVTLLQAPLLALAALSAAAGEIELAAYVGPGLPFYEQTFSYSPGNFGLNIPGLTVSEEGAFQIDTKAGLAAGASVTWYLAGPLGLEGRLDSVDAEAEISGAQYSVALDLPAPYPPLDLDVDLGSGTAELERLRPLSLNLKLKTPGPLRLTISGGLSYLPAFNLVMLQTVGLGVTGLDGTSIDVATLGLRADASEIDERSRLGLNAGAGLQLAILPRVSLLAEARGFVFDKHRLEWRAADDGPRSALEETLLQEALANLAPVEFNPNFVQVTAGVAVTF